MSCVCNRSRYLCCSKDNSGPDPLVCVHRSRSLICWRPELYVIKASFICYINNNNKRLPFIYAVVDDADDNNYYYYDNRNSGEYPSQLLWLNVLGNFKYQTV